MILSILSIMIRNWLTVRLFNATFHTVVLLVWRADRWNLVVVIVRFILTIVAII